MEQHEIADVLTSNGFQAFATQIRRATGSRALADGTTETRLAQALRDARTQLDRDYIHGMMSDDAGSRYQAALAALGDAS